MNLHYHQLTQATIGFAGLLRKAGLKVGSDVTVKTVKALSTVPLSRHEDLYWALYASMMTDHQHKEIFDQLFALYWGHARLPDSAVAVSLPRSKIKSQGEKSFSKRTLDAFNTMPNKPAKQKTQVEKLHLSWSDQERLQHKDFDSMSAEEYLLVQKLLLKLKLTFKPAQSRRFKSVSKADEIDFRNTLRKSTKYNAQLIDLKYKKIKTYYPALILFIDISGSMSRYAQIMLRFAHLLTQSRKNVHVYLFATRLTHISADLSRRDIDQSLEIIGERVNDWSSGTRIGECVKDFNHNHLRRIMNNKSEVILVTDGLDRGDQQQLTNQLVRLKRSCKTLIWLNPLLRYKGYQPLAKGATTLLPYVDRMLPVHNLSSLKQLIDFLYSNAGQSLNRAA